MRITTPPPITVAVGDTTTVTVEVTDLDPRDTLAQTWSIVSGPAILTSAASAATATVSCQAAGTVVLQVASDDGRGAAAIASQCAGSISRLQFGCGPIACLGNACDDSNPCCPGTACQNGACVTCAGARFSNCNDTPCCGGYICDQGVCTYGAPACMPAGGQCNTAHPCCNGVACVNGLCGNACVGTGAACDDMHPCCFGDGCLDGKCQITRCVPQGEACIGGQCCRGPGACMNPLTCQLPGCAQGNCPKPPLGCGLLHLPCLFPSDCCMGSCSIIGASGTCG